MESSRRDLLDVMAERTLNLKTNQNMYHPRFSLTPKTGIAFPIFFYFFFYCEMQARWNTLNRT